MSERNEDVETSRALLDMQQVQEMLIFTGRRSEMIIRTVTTTTLMAVGPQV
jgi:hypothetical protein